MQNAEEIKKRIREELTSLNLILNDQMEMSSLDLVMAAVRLEKVFSIRFDLDEIAAESFNNLDQLTQLILRKMVSDVSSI
jgi:acyl carrier protein